MCLHFRVLNLYPAGAVGLGWGALRGQIRMWNSDEIRNCAGFGARRMYRRPPRSANSDCRCCSPNGVAAHLALRWMVASTAVLRRRTKLSLHAPCIRETRKCDRSRAAHTPLCRGQLRKRAPTGSHGAPPRAEVVRRDAASISHCEKSLDRHGCERTVARFGEPSLQIPRRWVCPTYGLQR